jgi:hypothetical protein
MALNNIAPVSAPAPTAAAATPRIDRSEINIGNSFQVLCTYTFNGTEKSLSIAIDNAMN